MKPSPPLISASTIRIHATARHAAPVQGTRHGRLSSVDERPCPVSRRAQRGRLGSEPGDGQDECGARPEEAEGKRAVRRETPGSAIHAAERVNVTRHRVEPEARCVPRTGRHRQPRDLLPARGPGRRDRWRRSDAAAGVRPAPASCPTPATLPPPQPRAAAGGDTHTGPTSPGPVSTREDACLPRVYPSGAASTRQRVVSCGVRLPSRVLDIELPPFDPLNVRAAALRAEGHRVISLGQALPFFPPPEAALRSAREALLAPDVHALFDRPRASVAATAARRTPR